MNLQPKSRLTSLVLTILFSVLGLLYVAPVAAFVLLIITVVTGGLALPVTWLLAIAWGDHAVCKHNKNVAEMKQLMGSGR